MLTSTRLFFARAARSFPSSAGFSLPSPDHLDPIDRNVVLGHQIRYDVVGTAAAQRHVVRIVTRFIGKSFYGDKVALKRVATRCHLVQLLFGIRVELVGKLLNLKLTVASETFL